MSCSQNTLGSHQRSFPVSPPPCFSNDLPLTRSTHPTGYAFDKINDAVFDAVNLVEDAATARYPSRPEAVQLGLHKLETLLCSAVDKHFDLFEIWLHRNVFDFKPSFKAQALDHVRLDHHRLFPASPPTPQAAEEEETTWDALEQAKVEWERSRSDHLALLALSSALDRRLAALSSASASLADLTASAASHANADPEHLAGRTSLLVNQVSGLLAAHQDLRDQDAGPLEATAGGAASKGTLRKRQGFVNWAAARKVDATNDEPAVSASNAQPAPGAKDLATAKAEMQSVGSERDAQVRCSPLSHFVCPWTDSAQISVTENTRSAVVHSLLVDVCPCNVPLLAIV